jgi:hypothetical protein
MLLGTRRSHIREEKTEYSMTKYALHGTEDKREAVLR